MRRSALQRQILAYLRTVVDAQGVAKVTSEELAAATGSYVASIRRSMRRLVADGSIQTKGKRGPHGGTLVTITGARR